MLLVYAKHLMVKNTKYDGCLINIPSRKIISTDSLSLEHTLAIYLAVENLTLGVDNILQYFSVNVMLMLVG